MHALLAGGLAGLLATVPMSLVMKGWQFALPPRQRYKLPPQQITAELAERVQLPHPPQQEKAISLINHFAYGCAAGVGYGAVGLLLPPGLLSGVAFGLAVWGASYLGWLPLLGMRAAAENEPAARNVMMIASHLVWGACLGVGAAWAIDL